jgi:hypothetical protein
LSIFLHNISASYQFILQTSIFPFLGYQNFLYFICTVFQWEFVPGVGQICAGQQQHFLVGANWLNSLPHPLGNVNCIGAKGGPAEKGRIKRREEEEDGTH